MAEQPVDALTLLNQSRGNGNAGTSLSESHAKQGTPVTDDGGVIEELEPSGPVVQTPAVSASVAEAEQPTVEKTPDGELPSGVPYYVNQNLPISLYCQYQQRLLKATKGDPRKYAAEATPVNYWLSSRLIYLKAKAGWRQISMDDFYGTNSSDELLLTFADGAKLDQLLGEALGVSQTPAN